MRRMIGSRGYARARLASGALYIVLGAVIAVRTLVVAGFTLAALPGCVLGLALVALGAFRFRDVRATRND